MGFAFMSGCALHRAHRTVYAVRMLKLACLLTLFCAPLLAVAPEAGTTLVLESAVVDITLAPEKDSVSVSVSQRLMVQNTGDAADFNLALSDGLVPQKLHESFVLKVGQDELKPAHAEGRFTWTIRVAEAVQLEWTITGGATRLPHVHPLGTRELTVPLAHLRTYAALPESFTVTVNHTGLPGELFGREDDTSFTVQHVAGARVQNFNLSWFASTLRDKRAGLAGTLETFKDKHPTAENRLYTTTLAHAVDLAALAGDDEAVAAHGETLAALEAQSGHAITLCGPWAEWRRYVPWQLLRLRALEALGRDTADCAKLAVATMAERWPAYLKARAAARPFDEFDAAKFGSYGDYDWKTTRELYARALEINGDAAAAVAVAEVED
jgi:hypothetical protein